MEATLPHRRPTAVRPAGNPVGVGQSALQPSAALPHPRGITVAEAATLLRYSQDSILRMIRNRTLVAWKPGGPGGRKWLIDEVSLARVQHRMVSIARAAAADVQHGMVQGTLALY